MFPDKNKYKIEYSSEFVDIVLNLLNKDRLLRLGTKGDAAEILAHPWFASLNVQDIEDRKMEPPLKMDFSSQKGKIDTRFFNSKQSPQDLAETVLP